MENFGDFCGFTFNGYHSSDLGFICVSNSNRYTENLLPTFQDKTVVVPGGDGTYFFDSYYTQRTFQVNIAFDSMTEMQIRTLRRVLDGKTIASLIFDERPYKSYMAKSQGQPQLKYICFDQDGQRIYKGEGTLNFVAYNPYARSVYKYLDDYLNINYPNKKEWEESTGMQKNRESFAAIAETVATEFSDLSGFDTPGSEVALYNAGDVPADFKVYYSFTTSSLVLGQIKLNNDTKMSFSTINRKDPNDTHICINTKTNLIEGIHIDGTVGSDPYSTGTLYNDCITAGDFFQIPISTSKSSIFILTTTSNSCTQIDYDYLYY